jgi:protein-histidine pros-kinase
MVVTDRQGLIVLVNAQAEKLFGYGRVELLGKAIEELVPPTYRNRHLGHRDGYLQNPRVRPMGAGLDLYGLRKDGSQFPVEISLSPIKIQGETYVSSAIRDISARKQIENALHEKNVELQNANLAKDRFLASMSHELRTPLNAIIGFTGTLLMKLPGPLNEEQERQLTVVDSSARHLLSLIDDILDLAKIESGTVSVNLEPVSVSTVAHRVADSLRAMAEEKQLRLTLELPPEEIVAVTDHRALQQILLNLANNAIKYTDAGSVFIKLARVEKIHCIEISVTDTGIGIREEDQARLFQAFEQLDTSSTRRFHGVGLGLHLSRRLAELIGATLECTSTYGEGSTFTVSLPDKRS